MYADYSVWQVALGQLVGQLPSLSVWIGAMVLAVLRRDRHPQVSTLVLVAGFLVLLNSLTGTYLGARIPVMMREQGMSMKQFGIVMGLISLVRSLLAAATAGLVVWAIFGWRANPRSNGRTPTGHY